MAQTDLHGSAGGALSPANGLAESLAAYIADRTGEPAEVAGLTRLTGGSSRDMWAFTLSSEPSQPMVLRRDFAHSLLDTDLRHEFRLLGALHARGVPVPRPLWFEPPGSSLGAAFLIMERAAGADARKAMVQIGGGLHARELGRGLTGVQAQIHSLEWDEAACAAADLEPADDYPRSALDRWVAGFPAGALESEPLLFAAVSWLEAHSPRTTATTLVHGDFKANNILVQGGACSAVLDWELAHLGDPLEDVAWTLMWQTRWELVSGMLTPTEYLRAYADAAGVEIDDGALQYWRIFSLVKLASIMCAGMGDSAPGVARRPMLVLMARALPDIESRLADLLAATVRQGGAS